MTHPVLQQIRKIVVSFPTQCSFTSKKYVTIAATHSVKTQLVTNNLPSISKRLKQTSSTISCWKCGIPRENPSEIFCAKCNFIQSPSEKDNYFKVMDLDEHFEIDPIILKNKYRQLQTLLHPDRFTNRTPEEKQISAEFSALVNKAYNSLQLPLKRAEHLLKIKGEQIFEDESVDDPEFLMEMMSLNEEVENAKDEKKLRELDLKNRSELEEIVKDIDNSFKSNDVNKVKKLVVKMKYYSSLSNRINGIMREQGIVD